MTGMRRAGGGLRTGRIIRRFHDVDDGIGEGRDPPISGIVSSGASWILETRSICSGRVR